MSKSQVDVSLPGDRSSRQSIRKKNKAGLCDEVLDLVAKKLQSGCEGKFSAYAKYIVQELETLPKEMAMYCQRVINEAIFEAQMGSLNRITKNFCVLQIQSTHNYISPSSTVGIQLHVSALYVGHLQVVI